MVFSYTHIVRTLSGHVNTSMRIFPRLFCPGNVGTIKIMKAKSKRHALTPKDSEKGKSEFLEIRLGAAEKQAFKDAADLAGLGVSAWVRERLRRIAIKELQEASRPVAFLEND
jgi:hypothetical protein